MAPFSPDIELFNDFVMNIGILALVILSYNFIPGRLNSRSPRKYSVLVGFLFAVASLIGLFVLWQGSAGMTMVVNSVIVPLAGFFGGPIAAILTVAVILPIQLLVQNGGTSPLDIPSVMISAALGIAFFYLKKGKPLVKWSLSWQLLVLSVILGSILTLLMQVVFAPGSRFENSLGIVFLPVTLIIGGILILGNLIGFIDRKKEADWKILQHADSLKAEVHERTAELERINSLMKATLESTADGIIVTDLDGIVRAFNKRAALLLGYTEKNVTTPEGTKKLFDYILGNIQDPERYLKTLPSVPFDSDQITHIILELRDGKIYEINAYPEILAKKVVGRVWNFRDITDQKNAEDALKNANNKLVLLSSITRHDILNQLTALNNYHHLAQEKTDDPIITGYLEKMHKSLNVIQLQIEFTSDYQDMGIKKPVWHTIDTIFRNASGSFVSNNVTFVSEVPQMVEVFADPLLERAFYNLIDNSIRHGEGVSEIRVTTQESGGNLLIWYSDNGCGIPDDQKEKIFDKGFGKHTGLGMFLIREILGITGITIRENGIFGKGALFEIQVPAGKFRIGNPDS